MRSEVLVKEVKILIFDANDIKKLIVDKVNSLGYAVRKDPQLLLKLEHGEELGDSRRVFSSVSVEVEKQCSP